MNIAIVTGASSGLGAEFVKQLDEHEHLDEIWVIARRLDRLEMLAGMVETPIRPIPLDLTQQDSFTTVTQMIEENEADVRILINAAGMGKIGSWKDIPIEQCNAMIDINCKAAIDMTQMVLPYMKRGARILEICSSSAFQPLPYINIYAASKALLYRYSRALRWELFSEGISVTAVCPYWIKDTEFIETAQTSDTKRYIRGFPFASRAKSVAKHALFDAKQRLPVSSPGIFCLIQRVAAKFIPSEIMMGFWAILRRL